MLYSAWKYTYDNLISVPMYHLCLETILLIWVLWLIKRKKKHPDLKIILTKEEEEEVIRAWRPKSLVSKKVGSTEESQISNIWGPIEGRPGKFVQIEGNKYLNLATHNYLGFVDDPSMDKEAERCIRKYGVGSCGPRGFYGTVDVHLELEERVANFLGLEESALYSYGFSTIASAIPSYAKAGDIIYADKCVNFSIQKGLQASRSTIHYFSHNDYQELESLLEEQIKIDAKNPKKAKTQRRFCVVEGIYVKTGEMCPLNEINKLCRKHKVRLMLDETIAFGTIGATGRGVTEYLNVPVEDLDLISGSLENAFAAFGGFIVGSSFVVDHQRISGLGYCFSASLPPLLAGTGIQALKLVEENPVLVEELQANCRYMHKLLSNLEIFQVSGHELSPIKHVSFIAEFETLQDNKDMLDDVIIFIKDNYAIALVRPSYLEDQEVCLCPPSIRITVNRLLTKDEMDLVASALTDATEFLKETVDL